MSHPRYSYSYNPYLSANIPNLTLPANYDASEQISKEIFQTIQNTEQLVKRTKQYVNSIPIKSQFYENCKCLNKFAQTIQKKRSQIQMQREQIAQSAMKKQDNRSAQHPNKQIKFSKSPTPVQKLNQFQLDQLQFIEKDHRQSHQDPLQHETVKKSIQLKKQDLISIQQTNEQQMSPNQASFMGVTTFSPCIQQNEPSQFKLKLLTPKSHSQQQQEKLRTLEKMSTAAKSPLNKTFGAYSTYNSKPSSTKSGQKVQQVNFNIKTDQVLRYFKKKEKTNQKISSVNSGRTKGNISTQKSPKQKNKPQDIHSQIDFTNIEAVSSKFVTPLQRSPRIETNPQVKHQQFIRQCCTPVVRQNSPKYNSTKGSQKLQTPKNLTNQKQQLKSPYSQQPAVYPFQNIERQYEYKIKLDSPSLQGKINKGYVPSTSNKMQRRQNDLTTLNIKQKQIKKTASRYMQNWPTSPQIKQYHSIQINLNSASSQEKSINKSREKSKNRKRHGITVLLSTHSPKNIIKLQQNQPSQSQNSLSIEITNKINYPATQSKPKLSQVINRKSFATLQGTKNKKRPQERTIAERINEQLNRLQNLAKVENQISLRQSTKSKNKDKRQHSSIKQSKADDLKGSKKFQRKINEPHHEKKSLNKQGAENFKFNPELNPTKSLTIESKPKLSITQAPNITIYPSSLQKYKSPSNFQHQIISQNHNEALPLAFTPQKNKSHLRYQTKVPQSHIIRLQKSMKALEDYSLEKSRRKKIFGQSSVQKDQKSKRKQANQERIRRLHQKQVDNHNRSLEAKLYDFLIEEDSVSKRPSQKKNKFSPLKNKLSRSRWTSIFQSQVRSPSSSKNNSPRQSSKPRFNYRPVTQHDASDLFRSMQSFESSLQASPQSPRNKQLTSEEKQKFNLPTLSLIQKKKLTEAQIRKQIRRIKEYDFIQRYLTNYELEKLLREYIHKHIPARKWSLLVVDEVYNRIRLKKQQERCIDSNQ